jgi:hypothetical protein
MRKAFGDSILSSMPIGRFTPLARSASPIASEAARTASGLSGLGRLITCTPASATACTSASKWTESIALTRTMMILPLAAGAAVRSQSLTAARASGLRASTTAASRSSEIASAAVASAFENNSDLDPGTNNLLLIAAMSTL